MLLYGVKNAKIGEVDPEIFDEIRQFFGHVIPDIQNEPCQLWGYWTEFHEIFTQYTDIIYAVNVHIEVAISCSISECLSDESGEFAISV